MKSGVALELDTCIRGAALTPFRGKNHHQHHHQNQKNRKTTSHIQGTLKRTSPSPPALCAFTETPMKPLPMSRSRWVLAGMDIEVVSFGLSCFILEGFYTNRSYISWQDRHPNISYRTFPRSDFAQKAGNFQPGKGGD